MQNKISISTCFDYDIPLEEQLKFVAEAGFTHISLGSNLEHSRLFDEGRTGEIKAMLRETGLKIDTVHFSKALTSGGWCEEMEKTMQAANALDCGVIVVHCTNFMGRDIEGDEDIEKLKSEITKLERLCEKYKVKAALENLFPGRANEAMEKMLEFSDSAYIGFCYDSSHDQIDGPRPMRILEKYKSRLFAVHISDRIKPFVDHVLPGEGFIDFEELISLLKTADTDFPFLLEVMKTHSRYHETKELLDKAYAAAYDIIKRINA